MSEGRRGIGRRTKAGSDKEGTNCVGRYRDKKGQRRNNLEADEGERGAELGLRLREVVGGHAEGGGPRSACAPPGDDRDKTSDRY